MPQYRKKPVVIEAEQWFPGKEIDGVKLVAVFAHEHKEYLPNMTKPVVQTLEGQMEVGYGDYIITGVKGEKYPCKPDIFEATYEAV